MGDKQMNGELTAEGTKVAATIAPDEHVVEHAAPASSDSVRPMRLQLPAIIIIVFTLIGLYLAAPLFAPGIPASQDLPLHYARFWCAQQSGLPLAASWCPYFDAGTPFFRGYPILPFELATIFSWTVGSVLGYKLMLLVIYFVAPVGALLLLLQLGYPLAGAFAYALLLVDKGGWHSGGYLQTFRIGMFANALATGMMLVALAALLHFLHHPVKRSSLILGVAMALLIMSHLTPFGIFLLAALALLALRGRKVLAMWKELLLSAVLALGLVTFWLVPLLFTHAQGYFNDITFKLPFTVSDLQLFLLRDLHPGLLWLGLFGALAVLVLRPKQWQALMVVLLVAPAVYLFGMLLPGVYFSLPLYKLIIPVRLTAQLRTSLAIGAAMLLALLPRLPIPGITKQNRRQTLLMLSLLVFVVIAWGALQQTLQTRQLVLTDANPAFAWQEQVYREVAATNARILPQELYNQPVPQEAAVLAISHLESLYPVLAGADVLTYNGISFRENYGEYGHRDLLQLLAGKPAVNFSRLNDFFLRANVKWVLLMDPAARLVMEQANASVLREIGPYALYDTGVTPSYFAVLSGDAILSNERYVPSDGNHASVRVSASQRSRILFKVHDYPDWRVTIDDARVQTANGPGMLMEVMVPKGDHVVRFSYGLRALDIACYLVTVVSLLLLVVLWRDAK
ncbi:hypothetical protein COV94_03320, partial [Candidatus Woesearchaeota archaeon CG11_big_fil_rev_8_21_14_0_20_57_5]